VVKNIADFGAFVDLGGIDGLLHITDMSWDRINHPSALLKIDDEIEVKILNIDTRRRRSPWVSSSSSPARGRTSPSATRSTRKSAAKSSTS
jgi:transcriptional accessory protein Tex/SPT6